MTLSDDENVVQETAYSTFVLKMSPVRRRRGAFGNASSMANDSNVLTVQPTEAEPVPTVEPTTDDMSDDGLLFEWDEIKNEKFEKDDDNRSALSEASELEFETQAKDDAPKSLSEEPERDATTDRNDIVSTSVSDDEKSSREGSTHELCYDQAPEGSNEKPPMQNATEKQDLQDILMKNESSTLSEWEESKEVGVTKPTTHTTNAPPDENALITITERLYVQFEDKQSVTVKVFMNLIKAELNCELSSEMKRLVKSRLADLLTGKARPLEAALISTTDQLFAEVEDKTSITVKDFFKSVKDMIKCELDAQMKEVIRARLTNLITGKARPMEDDDEVSVGGDAEDSDSENESSASEPEADDEDEEFDGKATKKSERTDRTKAKADSKKSRSSKRRSDKKLKASAIRIQADKLRKKRLEELRVRNEELLLHQNKEDQERSERIAAKFETNNDEQRYQRLEKRLGLLALLDKKRITVIQDDNGDITKPEPVVAVQAPTSEEDSGTSDDEMELDFIGKSKLALKVLAKPSALSLLDMADSKVRSKHLKESKKTIDLTGHKPSASPGRSLRARAALKNKLLSKQRKMGNMWLARELGYKTEQEHLEDCRAVEQRKRELTLKREEERMKRNELVRQRILEEGEDIGPNEEDEAEFDSEPNAESNENLDDDELALAKAMTAAGSSSVQEAKPEDEDGDQSSPDDDGCFPVVADDESTADSMDVELDKLETQPPDSFKIAAVVQDDADSMQTCADLADDVLLSSADRESLSKDGEAEMDSDIVSEPRTGEANSKSENDPDESAEKDPSTRKTNGPRNSAWQAMLKKEAEQAKKMKKRQKGLVEDEADEEEEEEVAGLEDFGFVRKKKKDDDEESQADDVDEDDMENIVDELSDNEGDEDAGEKARKEMERKEEKDRHKEIMRRMREGYDGRKGGIAGGVGARGVHRFDELVAADNREDAKRLGLLNDDEMDSDVEDSGEKGPGDEEEDEALLLDKMLKDRFLHRSSVDMDENFSDDEGSEGEAIDGGNAEGELGDREDIEQEKLAKRFAKRARMQRLIEAYGHEEEFSRSKLLEEDATLKEELQNLKNGLSRKRSASGISSHSSSVSSTTGGKDAAKKPKPSTFAGGFVKGGSLAIALQASRRPSKAKTSFLRTGSTGSSETTASFQKSLSFGTALFHSTDSRSSLSNPAIRRGAKPPTGSQRGRTTAVGTSSGKSGSLWANAVVAGFEKSR